MSVLLSRPGHGEAGAKRRGTPWADIAGLTKRQITIYTYIYRKFRAAS